MNLTVKEFAEETLMHISTIIRKCDRNEIGHYRIGRRILIPRKDADAFLREHYHERYRRRGRRGA